MFLNKRSTISIPKSNINAPALSTRDILKRHPTEDKYTEFVIDTITSAWDHVYGRHHASRLMIIHACISGVYFLQALIALIVSLVPSLDPLFRVVYNDFTTWDSALSIFSLEITHALTINVGVFMSVIIFWLSIMHLSLCLQSYFYVSSKIGTNVNARPKWRQSYAYIEYLRDRGISWQFWLFVSVAFAWWNVIIQLIFGKTQFFLLFTIGVLTFTAVFLILSMEFIHASNVAVSQYFFGDLDAHLQEWRYTETESKKEGFHKDLLDEYLNTENTDLRGSLIASTELTSHHPVNPLPLIIAALITVYILIIQFTYFGVKVSSHSAPWLNYTIIPLNIVLVFSLGIIIAVHYGDIRHKNDLDVTTSDTKDLERKIRTPYELVSYAFRVPYNIQALKMINSRLLNDKLRDVVKLAKRQRYTPATEGYSSIASQLGERFRYEMVRCILLCVIMSISLWLVIIGTLKHNPNTM